MSADDMAEVEGLSLPQLAAAAGLSLATTTTYCENFAAHLTRVGPDRWAPINAALLQAIDGLVQAGYSTAAIERELDPAAPPASAAEAPEPPAAPAGPDAAAEPPAAPASTDYDPDAVTERLTEIRQVVKRQPWPSEKPSTARPWWDFWRR